MARAYFNYKGIDSRDMYLHIENDISFPSPEADVEFVEILGKDGDVAIDNERLKSVPFPVPVRIRTPDDVDINEIATEISNWLKSDVSYSPLFFSGSPDYEYIAISHQQFDVQETLKNYGRTVINFRLQPYKRRLNDTLLTITNGQNIWNAEKRRSLPFVSIKGNGNITIKNNGEDWIKLKSVDEAITIDSELGEVYRDIRPQYDKVIDLGENQFPVLHAGDNVITWTGNVTELQILPRWEAIT